MSQSETTKKIASNTFYQMLGKVFSMAITILATVVITRFYGREEYGAFSLMQNWPALFFIIVDFGLNAIATRELSKDWSKAGVYFGNILVIRTLLSLFFIFFLWIALAFFPYSDSLKFGIRLSLLLILMQALYTTTNIIFQVRLKYDMSTIGYLVGYLSILFLILVFALFRINVVWVSFSYVVGGAITFFVNLGFVRKLGVKPDFGLDSDLWKYLFIQTIPLGLMFIFSQINFKSDSILLSILRLPNRYGLNNTESVAVYNLPYKIFEVALVVPTFFMNSVYPVLVRHMMEGKSRLKFTFERSMTLLILSGVGAGLIGFVFAPFAIKVLGGSQFAQSVGVLRILMLGLVLYYATQPISWLIVTLGKQNYLPYIYLVGAIFNVTANYIFIPRYSFYASAVITHLSELIILIMLIIAASKAWRLKYA